jgi:hypothetical protein
VDESHFRRTMSRRWKLLLEVGGTEEESQSQPSVTPDRRHIAWDTLKDARRKLANAISSGNTRQSEDISQWIGGGLAVLASLTGEDAPSLLRSLEQAVPVSSPIVAVTPDGAVKVPDSNATYVPVERARPKPPPGAPKKLDLTTLSEAEREELGIILPEDVEPGPVPGPEYP